MYMRGVEYTLLCLLVAMLDALLIVCGDQRSLKNTDNLFSNSYSHSEVGKKGGNCTFNTTQHFSVSSLKRFYVHSPLPFYFLLLSLMFHSASLVCESPSQCMVSMELELQRDKVTNNKPLTYQDGERQQKVLLK